MEIKLKIQTIRSLIQKIEQEIDLSTVVIQFDAYEFLMKNRGEIENKFINKHRSNKEKIKLVMSDINQFNRQLRKILNEFEALDMHISQEIKK